MKCYIPYIFYYDRQFFFVYIVPVILESVIKLVQSNQAVIIFVEDLQV